MRTYTIQTKIVSRYKNIFAARVSIKMIFMICFAMAFTGCRKWIEVDPPLTQLSTGSVFATNTSAAGAMTGIYDQMESKSNGMTDGGSSISFLNGLAADELKNYSTDATYVQFYKNQLSSSTGSTSNYYYWLELYNQIYACNAVLTGLAASTGVTPAMKQQLTGEAKFMRAFLYFYAVNLYGDVPLVVSTDYQQNSQLARSPKQQVYQQITQDLIDAQTNLSDHYLDPAGNTSTEKIRPNKIAATALLARVYLYTGEWAKAETQATLVIENSGYSLPSDLSQVFLANSPEAILQFHPVSPAFNTYSASYLVLTSVPGTGSFNVALSTYLQNAFEQGDKRFANWIGTYNDPATGLNYLFPYKYKVYLQNQPVSEYLMVLRLAEQYLIRAEARANGSGSGLSGAIKDLNTIRNRAGLSNYTGTTDKASVLAAILHERQVELFTEWGHRWFDLIRTGNINSVLGAPGNICQAKGGNWSPDRALMPLPLKEMQIDPHLKQNPGY